MREIDRFVAGRRALHRKVQAQIRVALAGVVEQADVGQDHRVDAEVGRTIDGAPPVGFAPRLREGIDRHQYMLAARVGVLDALDHRLLIEVEPGEIARVGVVLVAEIHRVSAIIDGSFEGGKTAGGADEFGKFRLLHEGSQWAKGQVYRAGAQR